MIVWGTTKVSTIKMVDVRNESKKIRLCGLHIYYS